MGLGSHRGQDLDVLFLDSPVGCDRLVQLEELLLAFGVKVLGHLWTNAFLLSVLKEKEDLSDIFKHTALDFPVLVTPKQQAVAVNDLMLRLDEL